jgi:hypothetical protein
LPTKKRDKKRSAKNTKNKTQRNGQKYLRFVHIAIVTKNQPAGKITH